MFSTATEIPNKIWAFSWAFDKSNFTLFVTKSSLKLTNSEMKSFKPKILGLLFTIARVLNPKEFSLLKLFLENPIIFQI